MWQIISNISSIVTCVLFVLYIAGRVFRVLKTKKDKYEKFKTAEYEDKDFCKNEDELIVLDQIGSEFSISSSYGIRNISIYKVQCDYQRGRYVNTSKVLQIKLSDLNVGDTLFIKSDLGEIAPTTQIEIERSDFTKVIFYLYRSGENGKVITSDYKFKMTIKSFIYYLCV